MADNYFKQMYDIDVSEKVEQKNGLSYLSWAWAWAEVKKLHPDASYEIKKFGEQQLPYVYDPNTGYMVYTSVTIDGITHEMWLPVMDGANMAMKIEPYTYKVGRGEKAFEKTVAAADMFAVNKTIMRCLTKNLAMHGLGLYIYAGEDLPEATQEEKQAEVEAAKAASEALKAKVKKVVDGGSKLIASGVNKEVMMGIVSKYNDGNGNPASIKSAEVCDKILSEFETIKPTKKSKEKEKTEN